MNASNDGASPEKDSVTEPMTREEGRKAAKKLRMIDDIFMRNWVRRNPGLIQLILPILTGNPDLKVADVRAQYDIKNLVSARSVVIDVYVACFEDGKYAMEFENSFKGASPKRPRYILAEIDIENLPPGHHFDELPPAVVIMFTDTDIYGLGRPVYRFEMRETEINIPMGTSSRFSTLMESMPILQQKSAS